MKNASVIIIAVWALIFLSTLAMISGRVAHQEISVMKIMERRAKSYDLTYSGMVSSIDDVCFLRRNDPSPESDSLNDKWYNNPQLFYNKQLTDGVYSCLSGYSSRDSAAGQEWFGVVDEERKININNASFPVLVNCLKLIHVQEAEHVASLIIDWRDADDVVYNDARNLSERVFYKNAGYHYGPKNAPFLQVKELLLIKDFPKDHFQELEDMVTVNSSGQVNINTAPEKVLRALGFQASLVRKIISFRSGPDGKPGTNDDFIFASLEKAQDTLQAYCDLTDAESKTFQQTIDEGMVTVKSNVYTANCQSILAGDNLHGTMKCTFDCSGKIYSMIVRYGERFVQ